MPCLLVIAGFFFPRLVIVLLVIFGDYIGRAYDTWVWPLLGFFFAPCTTLAFAVVMNNNNHVVSGGWWLLLAGALLLDLGLLGGGGKQSGKWRMKRGRGGGGLTRR